MRYKIISSSSDCLVPFSIDHRKYSDRIIKQLSVGNKFRMYWKLRGPESASTKISSDVYIMMNKREL